MQMNQDQEMRHEQHGLLWLLRESDFQAVEALATAIIFAWGVVLALPMSTFDITPSFAVMRQYASEAQWSSIALVLSLFHSFIVGCQIVATIKGASTRARWYRRIRIGCVFLCFLWWVFVSLMLFAASPFGTGAYAYGGVATGALWAFLRLLGTRNDP